MGDEVGAEDGSDTGRLVSTVDWRRGESITRGPGAPRDVDAAERFRQTRERRLERELHMTNSGATASSGRKERLFGIGGKLYLYLGTSLAIILAGSFAGVRAILQASEIQDRIESESFPYGQSAMQVSQRTASLLAVSHRLVMSEGSDRDAVVTIQLREARALLERAIAMARESAPDQELISRIGEHANEFNLVVDRVMVGEMGADYSEKIHEIQHQLILAGERMSLDALTGARSLAGESMLALRNGVGWFVVLNIAGFIALGVSAWLFVRRVIVRRVGILASSMRRMARGDLQIEIDVGGDDELTDMGYALDIFREHAVEIQRLNLVEELSVEVQNKNEALEKALADLHHAQDQVIHQQKLAALGQLSAGVAHEIQNPLNFIKNFSVGSARLATEIEEIAGEMEKDAVGASDIKKVVREIKESLGRVVEHSKRADNIVKAMLQHSRTSSGQRTEVDVNALLSEFANLAYHSQRADDPQFKLRIEKHLPEATGVVPAVAQDLGRVFMNLVTNACQATAERAHTAEEGYDPVVVLSSERTAGWVHIRVRDNGPGIAKDVCERIFEPFFTTKSVNIGTGLGLSISHDIVRAHGGELSVASVEGEFAEFAIALPLTAA